MYAITFRFIGLFCAIALVSCGVKNVPQAPAARAPQARPNVVWIVLDACRADRLSAYGYSRPTSPSIDALAARGLLFERNFSQGPNTPQSVQNYMTGRYSAVSYHFPGAMDHWFLRTPPADEKLISTILCENGYTTAMFSASPWYIAESRLAKSFDHFQPLRYSADAPGHTWRERNPELFTWIAGPHDGPFFLYIHSLDTHGPRYRNNTHSDWLDPDFPTARDEELRAWENDAFSPEDQTHLSNLYDGGVAYADSTVGEILAALDAAGLGADTLVIVGSDHGELLGEDGRTLSHPPSASYDDLLHVPLIISGPGLPAGRRIPTMTQNADIVPTLIDLLGLSTAARFHGKTLRPAIERTTERLHEYVFARTQGYTLASEPGRVLIFEDLKFDFSPFPEGGPFPLHAEPRDAELVFAMPDRAGRRALMLPTQQQRDLALELLETKFIPMWRTKEALPKEVPQTFSLKLGTPFNREALSDVESPTDNLWSRAPSRFAAASQSGDLFVAHPATETVPGLILAMQVPDGEYHVAAYCVTLPSNPPRGASFAYAIRGQTDETRKIVGIPPPQSGEQREAWLELGVHTITGGRLRLWVSSGHPGDDTVIGNLVFRTATADAPSPEEVQRRREELEALGYMQ